MTINWLWPSVSRSWLLHFNGGICQQIVNYWRLSYKLEVCRDVKLGLTHHFDLKMTVPSQECDSHLPIVPSVDIINHSLNVASSFNGFTLFEYGSVYFVIYRSSDNICSNDRAFKWRKWRPFRLENSILFLSVRDGLGTDVQMWSPTV